jgi:hypothetical protein
MRRALVRAAVSPVLTAVVVLAGDALFRETFDSPSIARKPPWSIIYDAKDPARRIQNPALIEGRDGTLIAAWSNKGSRVPWEGRFIALGARDMRASFDNVALR